MAIKCILAGEVVATLHGLDAAAARAEFTARIAKRSFGDTQNLPVVSLKNHAEDTLGALISGTLDFLPASAVRRVAQQKGLRLIRESNGDQQPTPLTEASVQQTLGEVVSEFRAVPQGRPHRRMRLRHGADPGTSLPRLGRNDRIPTSISTCLSIPSVSASVSGRRLRMTGRRRSASVMTRISLAARSTAMKSCSKTKP